MNSFKHFLKNKLIYPILNNNIIKILLNIIIFDFQLFFAVSVVAGVAVAPHIALCVVETHFAIAINGALNTLLEVASALIDDESVVNFLVDSDKFGLDAHVFLKSSNNS
jgi:hypothetical protein